MSFVFSNTTWDFGALYTTARTWESIDVSVSDLGGPSTESPEVHEGVKEEGK